MLTMELFTDKEKPLSSVRQNLDNGILLYCLSYYLLVTKLFEKIRHTCQEISYFFNLISFITCSFLWVRGVKYGR
jgi:hypothetical protein